MTALNAGYITFAGNSGRLPELGSDQALKLKQLTVLTLAETNKVFLLPTPCFFNPLADASVDLKQFAFLFSVLSHL